MTHDGAHDVTDSDLPRVIEFLESHLETSLFLLSNLREHGSRMGTSPNSGNLRCLAERGEIGAVFCLTRRGNLTLQTGGRTDLAPTIVEACSAEPMRIEGVLGEWSGAASVWDLLTADARFRPGFQSKEILYRLDIANLDRKTSAAKTAGDSSRETRSAAPTQARLLEEGDFEQSDRLNNDFLAEEGLPAQVSLDQRRSGFRRRVGARESWGVFDGSDLVAIAGLNASYREVGQVGGVYTTPEHRRRGLQRLAMQKLVEDARSLLDLRTLILFTGQQNVAAQRLYESLGFARIGHFGLLFGSWKPK